ncbi:hypothetical protein ACKVWC_008635 [Pyricularia oryzae]|nr:hypothetical protein MCOR26_007152 [Pyricularia oryzae]KAI6338035.1 hypothetical protein MCOR30_003149 [Pyricularia oryzae]KAI6343051.1 hypothetical protein MCOR28_005052 [Pyricularia oryzae]KAI6368505.1 hypothetical protein MCOR32_006885 [Pyricularia oryzae]KAI6373442.1 hypothetical protein MCOR31_003248 [Pyricularia oryzae]
MRSARVLGAILLLLGTAAAQAQTTSTNAATTTSQSSQSPSQTSTTSGRGSSQSVSLPPISTSTNVAAGVTGLPTLSRTRDAVPTYPPPAVPPTSQAPFMQRSNLPQGTVFIAVGAILGAFGLTVLVWRAVIACLLHRDVERAAAAQHMATSKAAFPAPPAPFYKSYNDSGSNPNLLSSNPGLTGTGAGAGAAGQFSSASLGRGVRRTNRGPTPSATPSASNLFFSPTAAPGQAGSGSNRDSRFLPSGFYAAGAGQSSPGAPRHEHNISLSNLRPDSRGHARAVTPPDGSPQFGPSGSPSHRPVSYHHQQQRSVSTSTVNLNNPVQGRAPSAYLEDMLDDPNSQLHYLPGGARAQGQNQSPNGGKF